MYVCIAMDSRLPTNWDEVGEVGKITDTNPDRGESQVSHIGHDDLPARVGKKLAAFYSLNTDRHLLSVFKER